MQIQIRKMKTHKSQLNPNVKRTQLNSWNKRCKNEEHEKQPFQKNNKCKKVKRVRARADSGKFQKQCLMQNGGKRNNNSTIKRNDKGSSESSCLQLPSASLKAKYLTGWENEKNENKNVTWWENNVWREEKHEDGTDNNDISLIGTHSGQDVSLFRQEHPTGMKFQRLLNQGAFFIARSLRGLCKCSAKASKTSCHELEEKAWKIQVCPFL